MAKSKVIGRPRQPQDLAGKVFGKLTVVSRAPDGGNRKYPRYRWHCVCECGATPIVQGSKLRSGRTSSCGCTHSTRGGKSKTREYVIWVRMMDRCYRKANDNFRFYGAKGTVVCAAWRKSFDSFISDMGPAPSAGHTLDRKNPHGSYTCGHCEECKANGWPANCRWATKSVQDRNRRKHVRVTHNGKTLLLKEWAELCGVGYHALYSRVVVRGWPFELAISTPQGARAGMASPMRKP